jgi:glycosyltransferase involved in cell wall biosynthesis
MKIGLLHFRVGETDGVSLEMRKWKITLEKQGHQVHFIAGTLGKEEGIKVPLLAYEEPRNLEIRERAFQSLGDWSKEKLKQEIDTLAEEIYNDLKEKMEEFDIVVVNNIFSLAHNLSAAIALNKYFKEKNINVIGHHHDFYWEREYYSNPTSEYVEEILENIMPPRDIKHVVINSIAQESIKEFKGVDSVIVPNVFDFEAHLWEIDSYNTKILEKTGIKENDIVFLQATRVVRRKAIELAIDTLSELQKYIKKYIGKEIYTGKKITEDSRIILLMPGLDEEPSYKELLIEHAKEKQVNTIFCNELLEEIRDEEKGTFSLWDFYAISDFITYPSVLEGFGNQLLEGIFAKKPILVYEYPVYEKDIKLSGLEIVSLGNKAKKINGKYEVEKEVIEKCSKEILEILFDNNKAKKVVEKNFEIGKKFYSYETLDLILKSIFSIYND